MALRCSRLLRLVRLGSSNQLPKFKGTAIVASDTTKFTTKYKTEDNFVYLEDPNSFGTLTKNVKSQEDKLQDEDDIKEQQFQENVPLHTQKLTIKQYADIIKQYLKHKRLKEAIDVVEVRMLTVDRVKPENYLYNILIGACAEVGYTKKAFKLFNDMKRRGLKPTGDTYTCLFEACANSPWAADGLKNGLHLRSLMVEKGIEPNLTNYNAMIKAFGRCGDVTTAFQIVDEMISKKIKIRVHTFNHLLHACIADKNTGLRHALVVWRKMLRSREKPNIYSFNLMLKCVKDCNLGTQSDIEELIGILRQHIAIGAQHVESLPTENKLLESDCEKETSAIDQTVNDAAHEKIDASKLQNEGNLEKVSENVCLIIETKVSKSTEVERSVPNLLSKVIQMQQVLSLQEVHTVQDKFAVIGGQEDFLNEMKVYNVPPDIKTITQMLPLLDNNQEAENKLLETIKTLHIKADIDFYNLLIKKKALRQDYDGAFGVKEIIKKENRIRKKQHPSKKKLQLKFNIMTYGVLAIACSTKESAEKLLGEMKEDQLKINIEILGTLLKKAAMQIDFEYVEYVLNQVKEENIQVNEAFMKHLETFSERCASRVEVKKEHPNSKFSKLYRQFLHTYNSLLKDMNVEEALKPQHPWEQYQESYPETLQRSNIVIQEPKRFNKKKGRFVAPYKARL